MQTHAYGLRTHIMLTLQLIVNGNITHLTSNTIMENFYRHAATIKTKGGKAFSGNLSRGNKGKLRRFLITRLEA